MPPLSTKGEGCLPSHNATGQAYPPPLRPGGRSPSIIYYSDQIYFQKQNLEELQEAIIAQAEIMELKGDSQGLVEAVVIESKIDQGKG